MMLERESIFRLYASVVISSISPSIPLKKWMNIFLIIPVRDNKACVFDIHICFKSNIWRMICVSMKLFFNQTADDSRSVRFNVNQIEVRWMTMMMMTFNRNSRRGRNTRGQRMRREKSSSTRSSFSFTCFSSIFSSSEQIQERRRMRFPISIINSLEYERVC